MIVRVLWTHCVMTFRVEVRRSEPSVPIARVLAGRWLTSQTRTLLIQVPDKADRVVASLSGVDALIEFLIGPVTQPRATLLDFVTGVATNEVGAFLAAIAVCLASAIRVSNT